MSSPMISSLCPCIMDRLSGDEMAVMSQVLSLSMLVFVLPHNREYMAVALYSWFTSSWYTQPQGL